MPDNQPTTTALCSYIACPTCGLLRLWPAACRYCQRRRRYFQYLRNPAATLEKNKAWAEANPEKAKEVKRKSYLKHLDKHKAKTKQWVLENAEQMAAIRTNWRIKNPNYSKEWAARNKDKINSYSHNRRARYVGRYTVEDIRNLWERQRGLCENCKVSLKSGYNGTI